MTQWGQGPHFRTTTSNISAFQHSIILQELPNTFRDAILVTRRLGFRFLWVDSLCIVQDSHEDWVREAASMHLYYKRSALTIAVDSARGDREGFLHLRRKNDPPLAVFPGTSLSKPLYSGALTALTQNVGASTSNNILLRYSRRSDSDPLSERGWTLQENILSPRTLHYSLTELKWECQKTLSSETMLGLEDPFWHKKRRFLTLSSEPRIEISLRQWYIIVDEYANRLLTVSSDKLPAISGLAREFQIQMSGTYKAGIWVEDACHGLLWSYYGCGRRPDYYRAPSWSWAAMDATSVEKSNLTGLYSRFRFDGSLGTFITSAEVLDCQAILKDNDPYGAVIGGHLTLKTRWISWPRKNLRPWDRLWSLPPLFSDCDEILDYNLYEKPGCDGRIICSFDELPMEESTYYDPDFYVDVSLAQIVRVKHRHFALLLKPAKDEGKFVKIGVAELPPSLDEDALEEGGWVMKEVTIV